MRQFFHRAFIEHPQSVDETYFEHLGFALKFACSLFVAGLAALVHAFIPCACERTASNKIKELHTRLHNR
ncbi:MAG: DUF6356 family protein [Rhizobiaceae bacterium]|nr:DUF6356 family protein [Rhizobiaceae bacterium]